MSNIFRSIERESRSVDLRGYTVEGALPSFFHSEYPKFVQFLKTYAEFVAADDGFKNLVNKLIDARNVEVTDPELRAALKKEYGSDFPNFNGIEEGLLIRIFEFWYRSKGTKEAVEQYFRLFLGTEAEVVLPGDQMLRVSDGEWNDDTEAWVGNRGKLSESTMVIQDSEYYQIYSYLVRSGISILDWGPAFKQLAHPAGWIYFGEVRIEGLARFEFQTFSPTVQPGLQTRDSNILLFSLVALAFGAEPDTILKIWDRPEIRTFDAHSFQDVGINFLGSTYTVASFADTPIEDLTGASPTNYTPRRRPARIIITTS